MNKSTLNNDQIAGERYRLKAMSLMSLMCLLAIFSQTARAQYTTPTINGSVAANEYGTHTDGFNQNSNGGIISYVTWDATNLYVAVTGSNIGEAIVIYVDRDPQVPVNGGTNANGTNVGFNYDGANFAELQFRADLVAYIKNGYREYRTANGSNGWSSQTSGFGSYADGGSTQEVAIPWSSIGGIPASFNFFLYKVSGGGFVYNQQPTANTPTGTIGLTARWERYYTVSSTANGSATKPFSRNSYVFNATASNNSFGAISVYDFTMNSSGLQIARLNSGGDWNIGGTLVVNAGTVFFGSGGSGYGNTTVANVEILGGSLNMDQTNKAMLVTGDVTINSGGTLALSGTSGGDLRLQGNWTRNGTGILTPNSRAVFFQGANNQTFSGTTTFDHLHMGKSAGDLTINSGNILVNVLVAFSSASSGGSANGGRIITGGNNVTFNGGGSASGSSTTSHIQGNAVKIFTNGSVNPSFNFPVGDAAGFGPVTFTGSGTTTAQGNLSVATTAGDLNTPAGSGVNTSNRLHRYWTATNNGITGLSSFAASFTYPSGEAGGTPSNYVVRYTNGSNWFAAVVNGTPTNTNTSTTQSISSAGSIASSGVTNNFIVGELNTYTLTYTAGANGSISGTSPQTVNHGANGTAVTAVPDAGYHFVNWSDASTDNPRTDLNVTSNISVAANFAINTYTLTYTAGANGSISGTSPQTVNHGADGTAVTAVPDAGYHFVDWSDASTDNPRTDMNVTADINVTANFAINTYTLTYTAGPNGSISGTSPQVVNYGGSGTAVTAVADPGYQFVDWSDASTDNPRTDANVMADISVTANFELIPIGEANADFRTKASGNFSAASTWEYFNGTAWVDATQAPGAGNSVLVQNGHTLTMDVDYTVASGKTFNLEASGASLIVVPGKMLTITGTADFGGRPVTLQSDESGTAAIGTIAGAGANLTGETNITVERFIKGTGSSARRYHFVTAPVENLTINQAWQGGIWNGVGSLPATGQQTLITGGQSSAAAANPLGFDWWPIQGSLYPGVSIFRYNAGASGGSYASPGNTNGNSFNNHEAYLLFVRGDRSVTSGSSSTTLVPTGELKKGSYSIGVPGDKSHTAFGNPYPAPLDFKSLYDHNSGIKDLFWLWNPTLSSVGGYAVSTGEGDGTYTIVPTPVNANATSTVNRNVQSGQGIYVEPSSGAGATISILETDKAPTAEALPTPLSPTASNGQLFINLNYDNGAAGSTLADGVLARFAEQYNLALTDAMDINKAFNLGENLYMIRGTSNLIVEARPLIAANDTIWLGMSNTTARNYNLQFKSISLQPGLTATLEDLFLDKTTIIGTSESEITTYSFIVTSNAASTGNNRFRIVFKASGTLPLTLSSARAYQQGAGVQVDWNTVNERNMKQYEVEKSTDGRSFTKTNSVGAQNTISAAYGWWDAAPAKGMNFYRIKAIDNNGQLSYSQVLAVNLAGGKGAFSIYPNPVKGGVISLQLSNMEKGKYQLELYNSTGQRTMARSINHPGGSSSEEMKLGTVAAGVYKLVLRSSNGSMQTETLVVD